MLKRKNELKVMNWINKIHKKRLSELPPQVICFMITDELCYRDAMIELILNDVAQETSVGSDFKRILDEIYFSFHEVAMEEMINGNL